MARAKKVAKKAMKKTTCCSVCGDGRMMPGHCCCDFVLLKLSVAAFVLFVLTVWPAAMNLVASIHWGWFLAAWIIFGVKPLKNLMRCR